MQNRIIIGKITKLHGLKGEIKVLPILDNVKPLSNLKSVYIHGNEYIVTRCCVGGKQIVLGLQEIKDIENAKSLIGSYVEINKNYIQLQQDEYFVIDLINCEVFTKQNRFVGIVKDVQNFGASDIIFIENNKKMSSLVHIENVFDYVDIINKKIVLSTHGEEVLCDED